MTILGKMDQLVYATRIDRLLFRQIRPRNFRWIPLIVIGALVAGYATMTKTSALPGRSFLLGWAMFYGAYLVAAFLRIFGPRFVPTERRPLDEREAMVKARAYAVSGILLTSLAMLGCFYMGAADVLKLWHPHTPNDWISLGLGIQAGAMLLPTWIASWLEPRPIAEHED